MRRRRLGEPILGSSRTPVGVALSARLVAAAGDRKAEELHRVGVRAGRRRQRARARAARQQPAEARSASGATRSAAARASSDRGYCCGVCVHEAIR